MKGFSFRRSAMFCRLQLGEMYLARPWKTAGVLIAIVLFIIVISVLGGNGNIGEMMSATEDLVKLFVIFQAAVLYLDLTSEGGAIDRMTVPATCLEKYVALYAGVLLTSIVILSVSAVLGSAAYSAYGHFLSPGHGPHILFFGEDSGFWKDILLAGIIFSALVWAFPLFNRRKEYGSAVVLGIFAAYIAVLVLPGILKHEGAMPDGIAKTATLGTMAILGILNLVWGYRMLKTHESGGNGND